ncbi:MAG: hypothetical protein ACR2LC_02620 [Pyrinomonadaceae bacterium]
MRTFALILGLALAAAGGTILYRALFIEPGTGIVITDTNIREVPDALRTGGGILLLVGGACLAFLSARRK